MTLFFSFILSFTYEQAFLVLMNGNKSFAQRKVNEWVIKKNTKDEKYKK
jgi:hypothetical protein